METMSEPEILPLPPLEMRALVGPLEDSAFDNPTGQPVLPGLPETAWDSVLDFGCGCGRLARQLIQQEPRPKRYLGVDLHAGMIRWCQRNLAPRAAGFEFSHQDVKNLGLNPAGTHAALPFPVGSGEISLLFAWSVFTHVRQDAAEFYLREVARVLRAEGRALTTWFLFDKRDFPMMQTFQNALFINDIDPTNAVIFDRGWFREQLELAGLVMTAITPPRIRGYQWMIELRPAALGGVSLEFPPDIAESRSLPPPLLPPGAPSIGLDD
jgi:SAM-dependent methyltransferase